MTTMQSGDAMPRDRSFAVLAAARGISLIGDYVMPVVVPLTVIHLGGHGFALGVVLALFAAGQIGMSAFGGVIADRYPRRTVMIVTDAVQFAATAIAAMLLATGHAHIWQLAVLEAIFGMGLAVNLPAGFALVAEHVEQERLQRAQAQLSKVQAIAMVLGPLIGGGLLAWRRPSLGFAADAATFLASALLLSRLAKTASAASSSSSFRSDLAHGWRQMRALPWFWKTLICHGLVNLTMTVSTVLGALIVSRMAHPGLTWGTLTAATAIGMYLQSQVLTRVQIARTLFVGGVAALALAPRLLLLAIPAHWLVLAVAFALAAFGIGVLNTTFGTTQAQLIPDDVRARLNSWDNMVSFTTMPLGYLLVGPMASLTSETAVLVFAAALTAVPLLINLLDPELRNLRPGSATVQRGEPAEPGASSMA